VRRFRAAFGRLVVQVAVTAGVLAKLSGEEAACAARLDATGTLNVAPKDRDVVAYAYENSPTFRDLYDRLAARRDLTVWLESVPPRALAPASILGRTQWAGAPRVLRTGEQVAFRGQVRCQARIGGKSELASRFAHELAHAEELARYGSILRAPGVRPSADDLAAVETENGLATGAAVLAELAGRRVQRATAPLARLSPQPPVSRGDATSPLRERGRAGSTPLDPEWIRRLRLDAKFAPADILLSERPGRPG